MTSVKGLTFETAYNHAIWFDTDGIKIKTIHINELRRAKKQVTDLRILMI